MITTDTIKGIAGLIFLIIAFSIILFVLYELGKYDNVQIPDWDNIPYAVQRKVNHWGDTTYQVWIQEEEQSKPHPYGSSYTIHNSHYIPIAAKDTSDVKSN